MKVFSGLRTHIENLRKLSNPAADKSNTGRVRAKEGQPTTGFRGGSSREKLTAFVKDLWSRKFGEVAPKIYIKAEEGDTAKPLPASADLESQKLHSAPEDGGDWQLGAAIQRDPSSDDRYQQLQPGSDESFYEELYDEIPDEPPLTGMEEDYFEKNFDREVEELRHLEIHDDFDGWDRESNPHTSRPLPKAPRPLPAMPKVDEGHYEAVVESDEYESFNNPPPPSDYESYVGESPAPAPAADADADSDADAYAHMGGGSEEVNSVYLFEKDEKSQVPDDYETMEKKSAVNDEGAGKSRKNPEGKSSG